MPHRTLSPARSENEFDISGALVASERKHSADAKSNSSTGKRKRDPQDVSGHDALDIMASSGSDDEAIIAGQQANANRKASNLKGRTVKKGGGFQALGLNANLLKAVTRKGFSVPTPIQRKTIPLLLQDKDVVGMARTGSGKTAAFVIPLIEKLKMHSQKVGARALVLSPSRELALQTLQVVRELAKGTDLTSILLVGGDSLEEQFSAMASNPDIVIATPGRFLHLKVEMGLDLSSVRYAVFDEADRLFEMGFAAQLTEILHSLPASRQTFLFSATLPKTLVEFARAGLQDPVLVRLDADSKISPDLQSAFFTVKSSEKEGALLHILQDVIKVPSGASALQHGDAESKPNTKKRKRDGLGGESDPKKVLSEHSTIIFAATKHHVEYLAQLLRTAGYACSHIYGSLDQIARKDQVQRFRSGITNILVVTDVAARGIDIPILANVINYDFPSQAKIFVHRVGRTARAGQKGWSYSLVRDADAPYLLDLQLFLGRKLVVGRTAEADINLAESVAVGGLRRDDLQTSCEWVVKTVDGSEDLSALKSVAQKGEKLYLRTRNAASSESAKRAKILSASDSWSELHPLFNASSDDIEVQREQMLAKIGAFRPQESIFEINTRRTGKKGNEEALEAIRKVRGVLDAKRLKSKNAHKLKPPQDDVHDDDNGQADVLLFEGHDSEDQDDTVHVHGMSEASESELEVTFSQPQTNITSRKSKSNPDPKRASFRNSENFMSYLPTSTNLTEDRAYGVSSGSAGNFTEAARGATMDLAQDESGKGFGEARSIMRWDKRHKKYVSTRNDDDGSKGKRLVRGESGAKIAASFRSGRYDAWRKANRVGRAPRVGETEKQNGASGNVSVPGSGGARYKHKSVKAPKAADRYREDYHTQKKKFNAAKERTTADTKRKSELNSIDDIRKARKQKENRREKNARPSRKSRR